MIFSLLQGEIHVFTPTFREVGKLGSWEVRLMQEKKLLFFVGKCT